MKKVYGAAFNCTLIRDDNHHSRDAECSNKCSDAFLGWFAYRTFVGSTKYLLKKVGSTALFQSVWHIAWGEGQPWLAMKFIYALVADKSPAISNEFAQWCSNKTDSQLYKESKEVFHELREDLFGEFDSLLLQNKTQIVVDINDQLIDFIIDVHEGVLENDQSQGDSQL